MSHTFPPVKSASRKRKFCIVLFHFLAVLAIILLCFFWLVHDGELLKSSLACCCLIYLALYALWLAVNALRPSHASSVFALWYFFSLAAVATTIIGFGAQLGGLIDAHGQATGSAGRFILGLSDTALDFQLDIILAIAIPCLIVLPQLFSYALSGLYGCAAKPRWLGSFETIFFYGLAKSCIIAAGVLMPLAWFHLHWGSLFSYSDVWQTEFVVLFLIVVAFLLLVYKLFVARLAATLTERHPPTRWMVWLHKKATKYRQAPIELVSDQSLFRASVAANRIIRNADGTLEIMWNITMEPAGGVLPAQTVQFMTKHSEPLL